MLYFPSNEARLAFILAGLTWDLVLIAIMAKVVIEVLGWGEGIPVVIGVVVALLVECWERSQRQLHRLARRRSD